VATEYRRRLIEQEALRRGAALSAASGGLALVAVYTFFAPTRDIRARLPFLLDLDGGLLTFLAAMAFFGLGVLTLLIAGRPGGRAVLGVCVGSIAQTLLLSSNVLAGLLPQFESAVSRTVVLIIALAFAVLVIARERRAVRVGRA